MENDLIFDKIYNEVLWGVNADGVSTSGPGSHAKEFTYPYIIKTLDFFYKKDPQ